LQKILGYKVEELNSAQSLYEREISKLKDELKTQSRYLVFTSITLRWSSNYVNIKVRYIMIVKTIEEIEKLITPGTLYSLEYFTDGEGQEHGCSKIGCRNCCFRKIWDAENCFSVMSRVSGLEIRSAHEVKTFIKFFYEYINSFWRL